MKMNFTTQ